MTKMRMVLVTLASFTALSGCAVEMHDLDQPLTWEEFEARAHRDDATGTYVFDGDQTALNEDELRAEYERYLASLEAESDPSVDVSAQSLIVNRVNGQDDKWASPTQITYCVSQKSFGTRYSQVVADVAAAVAEWETASQGKVDYTHDVSQDGNCNNRNTKVTFDVVQDKSRQYYAKAFFPYYPRSYREVVISVIAYGNLGPWTLRGVLRHELGHTLGFRHEHIRPENVDRDLKTCSAEDDSWRALTEYDSSSVMHYPHNGCAGTNTGDLVLTTLDQQGVQALYP